MLSCPRSPARRVFTRAAVNEPGTPPGARGERTAFPGGPGMSPDRTYVSRLRRRLGRAGRGCGLHEIGYTPELVETGFHPLDGARYLRRVGLDGPVVSLVAYRSCAQIEADVRGQRAGLIPGNAEGIDGYS